MMAHGRYPAREIKRRLSEEEQEERVEKVRKTFGAEPVEDEPPAWKLIIYLDSGREITAELTDRDARALAQELGIRTLGVGVSGKGSFVFQRLEAG